MTWVIRPRHTDRDFGFFASFFSFPLISFSCLQLVFAWEDKFTRLVRSLPLQGSVWLPLQQRRRKTLFAVVNVIIVLLFLPWPQRVASSLTGQC